MSLYVTIALIAFAAGFLLACMPTVHNKILMIFSLCPAAKEAPSPQSQDTDSQEPAHVSAGIPVEDLGEGIVNVLGSGLGTAIDVTVSTGVNISSEVQAGAKALASGIKGGLSSYIGFIQGLNRETEKRE
jgi:hypothetical protein